MRRLYVPALSTSHFSPVSQELGGQLVPVCLGLHQFSTDSLTSWKISQPQVNWDGWSPWPGNEGGTTGPLIHPCLFPSLQK